MCDDYVTQAIAAAGISGFVIGVIVGAIVAIWAFMTKD